MAEDRSNSEEEEDSQAEAQGPSCSKPVHQDTRQKPRYHFPHFLPFYFFFFFFKNSQELYVTVMWKF